MIHAFSSGEYSFMDSSTFELWSDRDDTPVSARNYADTPFSFDHDEYADENIIDELDSYFGRTGWIADIDEVGVAVALETVTVWPYIVRQRVVLIEKYYGEDGWSERPYPIPMRDTESLMEPAVTPEVFQDCD